MPSTCIDTDAAGYERALAATPGAVRLPGGVKISECAARVRTDAELQNLGAIVHGVAETLAGRTRERHDVDAATRLGFLSAAVSTGAGQYRIGAELARRVETTTVSIAADPTLGAALRRGAAAGGARG
jgi:hypothetical protein